MNTGITTTTTTASTTTATTASTTTTTAPNSVLDKPLNELTEDDISQLTREDCRRYLKQKGMRRPSWNKSQAIQQVICLKSLLEPCSVVKAPLVRAPQLGPLTSTTVASNSSSSVKELSPGNDEGSLSALAEDGGPNQPAGPPCLDTSTEVQCHPASSNGKSILDRKKDGPHTPIGQMTIFYSGKVNVYDGLPVDKAKTIMHLAANPIQFSHDEPSVGNLTHWNTPCKLPTSNVKINEATRDIPAMQSVMASRDDIEGHANRQVSLQRYLEKRKDRGKFKVKRKVGSSSSGLETYLNHQMMMAPVTTGLITQTNVFSSTQFGIVPPVDSAVDKQTKHTGLSVDLNDKNSDDSSKGQTEASLCFHRDSGNTQQGSNGNSLSVFSQGLASFLSCSL